MLLLHGLPGLLGWQLDENIVHEVDLTESIQS